MNDYAAALRADLKARPPGTVPVRLGYHNAAFSMPLTPSEIRAVETQIQNQERINGNA